MATPVSFPDDILPLIAYHAAGQLANPGVLLLVSKSWRRAASARLREMQAEFAEWFPNRSYGVRVVEIATPLGLLQRDVRDALMRAPVVLRGHYDPRVALPYLMRLFGGWAHAVHMRARIADLEVKNQAKCARANKRRRDDLDDLVDADPLLTGLGLHNSDDVDHFMRVVAPDLRDDLRFFFPGLQRTASVGEVYEMARMLAKALDAVKRAIADLQAQDRPAAVRAAAATKDPRQLLASMNMSTNVYKHHSSRCFYNMVVDDINTQVRKSLEARLLAEARTEDHADYKAHMTALLAAANMSVASFRELVASINLVIKDPRICVPAAVTLRAAIERAEAAGILPGVVYVCMKETGPLVHLDTLWEQVTTRASLGMHRYMGLRCGHCNEHRLLAGNACDLCRPFDLYN